MENSMKLNKLHFVVLFVALFVLLNLTYTVNEMRGIYSAPNVRVNLYDPMFGVSGITTDKNARYEWKRLDNGFVASRAGGKLWLTKDCQVYVRLDKTNLVDTSSADGHSLSLEEVVNYLTDVCENETNDNYELKDLSQYISKGTLFLHGEIIMTVSGRYEGYIVLHTDHPTVSIQQTDFNQKWNDVDHFPFYAVLVSLGVSITASIVWYVACTGMLRKNKKKILYLIFILVPIGLLVIVDVCLLISVFLNPVL